MKDKKKYDEPTRISIFVSKDVTSEEELSKLLHNFIVALWRESERQGFDPKMLILRIVGETFELVDYIFPEKKRFEQFINHVMKNWFEAKKELGEGKE